jgi:hypothetical protein
VIVEINVCVEKKKIFYKVPFFFNLCLPITLRDHRSKKRKKTKQALINKINKNAGMLGSYGTQKIEF